MERIILIVYRKNPRAILRQTGDDGQPKLKPKPKRHSKEIQSKPTQLSKYLRIHNGECTPNSSKATRVCRRRATSAKGMVQGTFDGNISEIHEIDDKQMLPNVIKLIRDTERPSERDRQRSAKNDLNAAETDENAS